MIAKKTQRFDDLEVWQKAHKLVLSIYKVTAIFPREELFALTSQMRRAAVSVPANIAEGFKNKSPRAKVNFYNISQGSLEELRYYLILAKDLKYLPDSQKLLASLDEVARMLFSLINSISR